MMQRAVDILLVEDNEDDVLIIQEAFGGSRLVNVVSAVNDGEQALAYLRRQGPYHRATTPSLVLLDINMPKQNGFEVMDAMKRDAHLRSVPVIMLTMSERPEDITRAYASGACSYIRKPVNLDEFQAVVQRFERYWTAISKIPTHQVTL